MNDDTFARIADLRFYPLIWLLRAVDDDRTRRWLARVSMAVMVASLMAMFAWSLWWALPAAVAYLNCWLWGRWEPRSRYHNRFTDGVDVEAAAIAWRSRHEVDLIKQLQQQNDLWAWMEQHDWKIYGGKWFRIAAKVEAVYMVPTTDLLAITVTATSSSNVRIEGPSYSR